MIFSLGNVVTPFQRKIKTTTAPNPVTVLCLVKEPGGKIPVTRLTLMVCIITDSTHHHHLMVSIGEHGRDTITPLRELR